MLGIDLNGLSGRVAALQDRRPIVLGEGNSFPELVAVATARLGQACLETTSVVTVSAWFNDEQRKEVLAQAAAAGLSRLRLMNRPTAVAMAHAALDPGEWSTALVLNLDPDRFDLTLLRKSSEGFEILAADGSEPLGPAVMSDAQALAREVKLAALHVLRDGRIELGQLGALFCAGEPRRCSEVRQMLLEPLGLTASTAIPPDHAAALGAALQAGLLPIDPGPAPAPAVGTSGGKESAAVPSRRGGGCTGLLVSVILVAIAIGGGAWWIWMD